MTGASKVAVYIKDFMPAKTTGKVTNLKGRVFWPGVVELRIGVQHRPRHVATTRLALNS